MKKRLLSALLMIPLFLGIVSIPALSSDEQVVVSIDSINGTRWEDTMCVYRNRPTTLQNQWGDNIVVDKNGKVIEKVERGNTRGRNLKIPEGGMVVSGTNEVGKYMFDHVSVGDNAYFDEYGMRVLFSKGEVNPFYSESLAFSGYNQIRYAKKIIVYDREGETTGTNGYGFEVCVDKDGMIISAGGNDNAIPSGGFVVSAVEPEDKSFLKAFFIVGARCTISGMTLNVEYSKEMLTPTVERELEKAFAEIETAKSEFRLVDTEAVEKKLNAIKGKTASTLKERDALIDEIRAATLLLTEKHDVEVRSTWYVPLEKNAKGVRNTVEKMASVGINQLCLGVSSGYNTIVPLPDDFPFTTDPTLRKVDLLEEYVKCCKEFGIELVVSISLFHGNNADVLHPEWLTHTNEEVNSNKTFYSPANDEYIAYLCRFVTHLITNYDIDGIQWDYIRFDGFNGTVDFGYDDATKEKFEKMTGLSKDLVDEIGEQLRDHPNWNDWVEFKVDIIDGVAKRLAEVVRKERPDLYITACVANDTRRDVFAQDCTTWLENRWVDGIYPMSYAEGIMGSATEKFSEYITENSFLVMGGGSYLSLTMDEMYLQVKQAMLGGADGFAFFEWGAYYDHGYADEFAKTIFNEKAVSFTHEESKAVSLLLERAAARFEKYKNETELFKNVEGLDALKEKLLEKYDYDERLFRDLDLAIKINNFSREEYKESDDVSGETSTTESATNESTPEAVKNDNGWVIILIVVLAVLLTIGIIGGIIIKRKAS